MTGGLEWLSQFFDAFASLFPRRLIVRATEGGIKWRYGYKVIPLSPGVHWYWPLLTDIEKITTARQPLKVPPQTLYTKDREQVSVNAAVFYRISDVVLAIGEKNHDVDQTLIDLSQAVIGDVITEMSLQEIQDGFATDVRSRLTEGLRKQVRRYGACVYWCRLTEFSKTRVLTLAGSRESI